MGPASVTLANRRKTLGYSQESLAEALGVDRTTVSRWERGKTDLQPHHRDQLARLMRVDLVGLDELLGTTSAATTGDERSSVRTDAISGSMDDMIRREFLRALAVAGALAVLPTDDSEALADGTVRRAPGDFEAMNAHLWQVYQLARTKGSVYPIVRDQLAMLTETLGGRSSRETGALCGAASDLFQLAGELAFDANRYTDAAASYTLAAAASKDAAAYDLWACALVRHSFVDVYERRYKSARGTLEAAERVAKRGDSSLSTRYWVASVQAEVYAGLNDLPACERALDKAEQVQDLSTTAQNGGWLRFDGTRLAEARGARYVQLGLLDLAEQTLLSALNQGALAQGQSFRRRGAVLTDLAAIGIKRRDPEQVMIYAGEALQLAQQSQSGYVARRLQALRADFGPLDQDARIRDLVIEINMLKTM
jgi:transcriptional regulator with XRE-family HTH domain